MKRKQLIGSWRGYRSEIPSPYNPRNEFLHFCVDGDHYWELPFLEQDRKVFQSKFRIMKDNLCFFRADKNYLCEVEAEIRGATLRLRPSHGYWTYFRRLKSKPKYLRHFVRPL
jgi:hypothetical protein